jgi:isoleucyl-tRNA synthetase
MSPPTLTSSQPAHDATMLTPTQFLRASWSFTLRLPKSDFPARPLAAANAEYLRRCTDELYSWQQSSRTNHGQDGNPSQTFTLHDGPPYANGPLHIGHALNKITKDIICRYQVGQGRKVSYIPGWDCHGLPIEIKALQAAKKDANTDSVSVRAAARELATRTVEEQKEGFKEWAVMGDWDNAYKTMDRGFEIRQLEVFKKMFEKGLIYRQFKPVYWSPSSRTALAEAELEYDENHKSMAAFVRFPVVVEEGLKDGALETFKGKLGVVIWTTTPWTLPANKAIAVHKDMEYCVVQDTEGELTIVAASRVQEYQDNLERELTVVRSGLHGSDLAGNLKYENPFQRQNGLQSVIHADFVTSLSGTGLVHLAPGHGMDDYHVCSAMGLPAFAPIDDAGAFTEEAFPEQPEVLQGLFVADAKKSGTSAVINYLKSQNLLRGKHSYRHKYPIDWRTKEPVIVRATEQWFANVDRIKEGAMKAIEGVKFVPDGGRPRLESFIQGRSQWCISRQRAWGVPIPALYKVNEGKFEAIMNSEIIQNVIDVVKKRGIDAWWTDSQDEPAWKPENLSGPHVRGRDTMDVWFDSGTSWTLLPERNDQPVADVYLEGTDQHRGWFQSSLLTHVATQTSTLGEVKAPYKTLITHGFTLDSEGRKMSKSIGNVISPSQIMSGELLPPIKRKKQKGVKQEAPKSGAQTYDAMGSDALRLWVASSDYTRDVTIGQPVLLSVNQALHKYRVTFKWLLGIFSLPTCPPAFTSFSTIRAELPKDVSRVTLLTDKLALHRLAQVSQEVHDYYAKYEFFKGVNTINKYISQDLSAFYFETLKDRIYTGPKSDCQALQNVLGIIFYELTQMLAPICPLLIEEVWDYVPAPLQSASTHPARASWTPFVFTVEEPFSAQRLIDEVEPTHLDNYQECVNVLGRAIKAAQERLREKKMIGSSLECNVLVSIPDEHSGALGQFVRGRGTQHQEARAEQLAGLFVVSGFEVNEEEVARSGFAEIGGELEEYHIPGGEKAVVWVSKSSMEKCPRCWRFVVDKPHEVEEERLCGRCEVVVKEEGL